MGLLEFTMKYENIKIVLSSILYIEKGKIEFSQLSPIHHDIIKKSVYKKQLCKSDYNRWMINVGSEMERVEVIDYLIDLGVCFSDESSMGTFETPSEIVKDLISEGKIKKEFISGCHRVLILNRLDGEEITIVSFSRPLQNYP